MISLFFFFFFVHSSSFFINCPITIKQLIELINTNKLPYYNIKTYLPTWMRATGRDRFNLERLNIHSSNLFFYYYNFIQPVIKPYTLQFIFQSSSYFYELLLHICEKYCQQIYFPFDHHTRILFESLCQIIIRKKSTGRRFLSTSLNIELTSLSMIIILILLRVKFIICTVE